MSELLFSCLIEVPKHSSKKNKKTIHFNKKTRRSFIGTDSKTKHLDNVLNAKLLQEKLKSGIKTINCDVNISFTFFFPEKVFYTKQSKRSSRVGDLSNLCQGPEDSLQKVGIILNDSIICGLDGSRRKPTSDNIYQLMIVITKI